MWYGLVLLAVVAGFGIIFYVRVREAKFRQVDAHLEQAVLYIDISLRRFLPRDLEDPSWERLHPSPPERGRPDPPPELRPPPNRERLLADMTPVGMEGPFAGPDEPGSQYFAVWRSDGSLLKSSPLRPETVPPDPSAFLPPPHPLFRWRGSFREATLMGPFGTQILVGRAMKRDLDDLNTLGWQLTAAGAAVLALGLTGGWLISARIFRPIKVISATAAAISATRLSERIDQGQVDRELAGLAGVLNAMFDRLEEAFEQQRRFTADASHELRTPLAILRSHTELALSRPRTPAEYQKTLDICLRAIGRMQDLVQGLLTLARADAGKLELKQDSLDLVLLVKESVALLESLAGQQNVRLSLSLSSVIVCGDAQRLGQVVTNLLTNAILYNRPGGEVTITLSTDGTGALLEVADSGVGIPEEDQPHIFERFYRVDRARSRATGSSGLGLAICKSIVEAHKGGITFTSKPQEGTSFRVWLPAGELQRKE